jgi:hypothetical protein
LRPQGLRRGKPDYIELFCAAIPREAWEIVGPLDETLRPAYYEDVDWCLRATDVGYALALVDDCCRHLGGASSTREELLRMLETNRLRLLEKRQQRTMQQLPSLPATALPVQSSGNGRALWVMASIGCSGGAKVAYKMMCAMQDAGWQVDVWCLSGWQNLNGWAEWSRFNRVTMQTLAFPYEVGISTFHSTMPFVHAIPCAHHVALIQSDEPEWKTEADAEANFRLPGFKHIIIADHMQAFAQKYGMNIIGQLDNGVDGLTFYPDWFLERKWPHSLMFISKNGPVWYAAQEFVDAAVVELSKRYADLEAVVVGGSRPNLPCRVRHVRTYDQDEMRRLYNSVSCMVRPSLIEGSSLTDMECLATGTPFVCTPIGTDWARDGENALLVPFKDSHAIAEAVSRLFDDTALCEKLAREGLRVARERTWEREQTQFMRIIGELMEPK